MLPDLAIEPDTSAAHEPNAVPPSGLYNLIARLLYVYFKVFHCVRITGQENIPPTGPVIIAPNHLSYYDPPLIGSAVPRQLRYMAWNALFCVPLLGRIIRRLGAFAVDPSQPDTAAYRQSLAVLKQGCGIVVFPEGKRGLGDRLEPFENGVARLALRSGAWVVPATLTGLTEAWPRWHKIPRLFRPLQVKFHPAVDPKHYSIATEKRQAMERLTSDIRRPIERRYQAYLRLLRRKGRRLPAPPADYPQP